MIRPALDFDKLYGAKHVYSGFAHPATARWLPSDPELMRSLSGNQIAIVGRTPIVCARGALQEVGLDLLREAGIELPAEPIGFDSLEEYAIILSGMLEDGYKLILQHRHPADVVAEDKCWINQELLSTLNDKSELANFVSSPWLPERHVFDPSRALDWNHGYGYPFLLKAGTRLSTGGGGDDVFICRSPDDIAYARSVLIKSERVVAEKWIAAERSFCLNYAVDATGNSIYIGGAEIVSNQDGVYGGNWLGDDSVPQTSSVEAGMSTVKIAAALGYRGLLGVDIAESQDTPPRIFDLNFRLCGSTVALLMMPAIRNRLGPEVARVRSWRFNGSYPEMIAIARKALRKGVLFPLATYCPQSMSETCPPRLHGILLGNKRSEVDVIEKHMHKQGWF